MSHNSNNSYFNRVPTGNSEGSVHFGNSNYNSGEERYKRTFPSAAAAAKKPSRFSGEPNAKNSEALFQRIRNIKKNTAARKIQKAVRRHLAATKNAAKKGGAPRTRRNNRK